jgi:ABC-type sugar transport system ATPase subunit
MRQVANRIHVLHHGTDAGTLDAKGATRDDIVSRMIGGMPDEGQPTA